MAVQRMDNDSADEDVIQYNVMQLQPECMKFKVSVEKESCDDALV